ncbi:hypothetical protein AB0F43_28295 [Kribbella sp. NPDC023972]|uniref:hypothetical protein n=1 Tax=Kribbella sp. NPDC023972 TaxID=3154795 RepID=UPI003411CC98
MTEHPGEQFPPDVDPDVEPGFDPYPSEDTPETPDYDAEPGPQDFSAGQPREQSFAGEPAESQEPQYGGEMAQYGEDADEGEVDTEAAFAASVDEPVAHVDPAEVEFGPEFARAPGAEHEHPFAADSAVAEHEPAEEPAPEDPAEHVAPEYPAEHVAREYPADDVAPGHSAEDVVPEDPAENGAPEYPAGDDGLEEERAHPLVEETMGRLDELRERPVGEHAEVYADLHERLQSALVEADAEPGDRR